MASQTKVHVVLVSNDQNALIFNPSEVTAAAGDFVQFQFASGNHSIVKGDFNGDACAPATPAGFFSGFVPAAAAIAQGQMPVFTIDINNTDPIAYYCSQAKHCQAGMVGVINPSGTKNFETYAAAAQGKSIPDAATTSRSSTATSLTKSSSKSSSDSTSPTQQSQATSGSGSPPAATVPPNPAPDGDGGFSKGAQAGIGIGVAVAVAVMAVLIAGWFFLRRRRRNKQARAGIPGAADSQASASYQKPELEAVPAGTRDTSKPPQPTSVYELDGVPPISELGTRGPT